MTAIYTTLISTIQTTLNGITAIKATYAYPAVKVDKYPAVIFFPDALENSFESNQDNMKTYRFKMYVVVGTTEKDKVDIFSNAVDAVISAFDTAWNAGTLNGHRVWVRVSSGNWTMGAGDAGLEAQAELTVEFKFLTTVGS